MKNLSKTTEDLAGLRRFYTRQVNWLNEVAASVAAVPARPPRGNMPSKTAKLAAYAKARSIAVELDLEVPAAMTDTLHELHWILTTVPADLHMSARPVPPVPARIPLNDRNFA